MPAKTSDETIEIGPIQDNKLASQAADTDGDNDNVGLAAAATSEEPPKATRRKVEVSKGRQLNDKEYKLLGFTDNSIRSYKYPWALFIPMNLFEQFQRVANIYFLVIVIISFIPALSPQTPITSLAPLVLVLALQAVKDGLEDLKRHRSDDADNNSPATVIRDGVEMHIKRMEVRVGDILVITKDPESESDGVYVAADCVLLATKSTESLSASGDDANSKGICYINTKQLDGETNLKIFQAKPETACRYKQTSDFGDFECVLECDGPDDPNAAELYKFSGKMGGPFAPDTLNLTKDQLLLRGHSMEQTYKAWGLVVNTGMQTKIQKNLESEKPYKMSSMEVTLNQQVIIVFMMLGVCVIICGVGLGVWLNDHGDSSWFIFVSSVNNVPATFDSDNKFLGVGVFDPDDSVVAGIYGMLTFIVVLSTFVPISLYVTIEMIKFVTGLLIDWDMHMFSEDLASSLGGIEKGEDGNWDGHTIASMEEYKKGFAKCKSSKLVEQLGQVQYVLSDKTGTLTRNKMELCKAAIVFEKDQADVDHAKSEWEKENNEDFYDSSHEFGKGVTEIEDVKARMRDPPQILEPPIVPPDTFKYQHEKNKHVGTTFEFYDPYLNATSDDGGQMIMPFFKEARNLNKAKAIKDYFLALALCNTVVPEDKNKKDENGRVIERFVKYNAASPDDGALVKAAMNMGYTLKSRHAEANDEDRVVLEIIDYVDGQVVHHEEEFIIHGTLDADSVRKRMSVVVSGVFDGEHKFMVITKGADNIVMDRCAASYTVGDQPSQEGNPPHLRNFGDDIFPARPADDLVSKDAKYLEDCAHSSQKFAEQGLRCMCVAQVEISEDRMKEFLQGWQDAKKENQESVQAELENRLEYNLRPLGITAIEDKLQKNVGRCLKRLGKSGIRTWVLTGDKVDTAINIGYACNLLNEKDHLFIMLTKDEQGQEYDVKNLIQKLEQFEEEFSNKLTQDGTELDTCSLVIEGEALSKFGIGASEKLAQSWSDQQRDTYYEQQSKLIRFAGQMSGVVCCRVSPKQKGDMTKLVKEHLKMVCLGIGDGANDVEMILQGDVGVGVQGVEGSQAVNNSDFAITEFQHLENLLLVHGRWTYGRIAISVCYFFYKNIAFTMCVFWFACFSAFSGQLFFEAWSAASYNVFFTALPVLVYGLTNQDLDQEIARKCPALYGVGQRSEYFNYGVFIWWISEALYASIIMFFFGYAALASQNSVADGRSYTQWSISTTVYAACVPGMTIRIALETSYWTWVTHLTYWGSIVVFFVYQFITNSVGVLGLFSLIPGYGYQYWVIWHLFQSGAFWLYIILVPVVINLPYWLYVCFHGLYFPSLLDKCRNSKYWKELVMAGLLDAELAAADMTEEERMRLYKRDTGTSDDKPLTRKGTSMQAALKQVPADSMGGGDNVALWSGRKNLTGAAAIRKAARRVIMQTFMKGEMDKELGRKDRLKGKFSKGGLSSSARMLASVVEAEKASEELRDSQRFKEQNPELYNETLRQSQEAAADGEDSVIEQ
eukprot:TRINITY_DN9751_c0_g1_i5.p1 TRINITY_DN9751_c0_g1~~TRINITY_DN9751_c0_g1_i5.p1  ORF type:complete len:1512 (-),score=515.35 TRINITY_DN9751_c0_g1_i5:306-4841(-)